MKVIINEVEYEKIISGYLDRMFSNVQKNEGSLRGVKYIWFTDSKNEPMLVWNSNRPELGLNLGMRKDLWNLLEKLFQMETNETTEVVGNWFKKKIKKNPTDIYTF